MRDIPQQEKEIPKNLMAGYCKLCREKEVELYGTVLVISDLAKHEDACKQAGCRHPAFYDLAPKFKGYFTDE